MPGASEAPAVHSRDIPTAVWIAVAMLLLAIAVVLHGILPRYEFRVVENGRAIIVYDRWSGRFQRANYDENGNPTLTSVVQPF
jgi:hypothetical protein